MGKTVRGVEDTESQVFDAISLDDTLAEFDVGLTPEQLKEQFEVLKKSWSYVAAYDSSNRRIADTNNTANLEKLNTTKTWLTKAKEFITRDNGQASYSIIKIDSGERNYALEVTCKTNDDVDVKALIKGIYSLVEEKSLAWVLKHQKEIKIVDAETMIGNYLNKFVQTVSSKYSHSACNEIKNDLNSEFAEPLTFQDEGVRMQLECASVRMVSKEGPSVPDLLQTARAAMLSADFARAKSILAPIKVTHIEADAWYSLADLCEKLSAGEIPNGVDFKKQFKAIADDSLVGSVKNHYNELKNAKQKLEANNLEDALTHYSTAAENLKGMKFTAERCNLLELVVRGQNAVKDFKTFQELDEIAQQINAANLHSPELAHAKNTRDQLVKIHEAYKAERERRLVEAYDKYFLTSTLLDMDKKHLGILKLVMEGIKLFNEKKFADAHAKLATASSQGGAVHGNYVEALQSAFEEFYTGERAFSRGEFTDAKAKLETVQPKLQNYPEINLESVKGIVATIKDSSELDKLFEAGKLAEAEAKLESLKKNSWMNGNPFISNKEDTLADFKEAADAIKRKDFDGAKTLYSKRPKVRFADNGAKALQSLIDAGDASKSYETRVGLLKKASGFGLLREYAEAELGELVKVKETAIGEQLKEHERKAKEAEEKVKALEAQTTAAQKAAELQKAQLEKEREEKQKVEKEKRELEDLLRRTKDEKIPPQPPHITVVVPPYGPSPRDPAVHGIPHEAARSESAAPHSSPAGSYMPVAEALISGRYEDAYKLSRAELAKNPGEAQLPIHRLAEAGYGVSAASSLLDKIDNVNLAIRTLNETAVLAVMHGRKKDAQAKANAASQHEGDLLEYKREYSEQISNAHRTLSDIEPRELSGEFATVYSKIQKNLEAAKKRSEQNKTM